MGRNNYFKFKQFTIVHEKSGMKVGTDGVLIGAWATHHDAQNILDIGCGSGLIPLMLAQRTSAHIVGVEIDKLAAEESIDNIQKSPWTNRIEIVNKPIQEYQPGHTFDLIVSNPPYFTNGPMSPNQARKNARHTDTLCFNDLLSSAARLLKPDGSFCIILPAEHEKEITSMAADNNLHLNEVCYVKPKKEAEPKRILFHFNFFKAEDPIQKEIFIEKERHVYSDDYIDLTKDFYLNM